MGRLEDWPRRVRLVAFVLRGLPYRAATYRAMRTLTRMDVRTLRRAIREGEGLGVLFRQAHAGRASFVSLTPAAKGLFHVLYQERPACPVSI